MPEYRYYTVPLLTSVGTQIQTELDLSSVHMDRQVGGPGNFSGTLRLGHRDDDRLTLLGSVPGYHALVCKRNGVPIWAGPIWSRTYESEGQTLSYTAQTYESIFERLLLSVTQSYVTQSFGTVVAGLISFLNSNAGTTFGITYLAPAWGTEPDITIRALAEEYPSVGQFIDDLCAQIQGNYRIDIGAGTDDAITKQLTFTSAFPSIIAMSSESPSYEYPGVITKYWWPETSIRGGMLHVAKIGNKGATALSAQGVAEDVAMGYPPDSGWPNWFEVTQWPSLSFVYGNATPTTTLEVLQGLADWQAISKRIPRDAITIELGEGHDFKWWNDLGSVHVAEYLQDARWPSGIPTDGRKNTFILGGWSLDPESSESPEVLRLTELENVT